MRGEIGYSHSMRAAELKQALVVFNCRDGRFLGIGGGDGWKASLLACRFDAEESVAMPECTCFPVQRYNCRCPMEVSLCCFHFR